MSLLTNLLIAFQESKGGRLNILGPLIQELLYLLNELELL